MATVVDLDSLLPARSDRVCIFGQTGSGKTTLARAMLQSRTYTAVLDVKGTIRWPGYVRVTSYSELLKLDPAEAKRIVYAPRYAELHEDSSEYRINDFFRWLYERGNCTGYVDELAGVTKGDAYPYYYGACLMRGRELGVEIWSGAQRPTRIPQIAMSEAEHVYCFRLRMQQDRERVERLAGIPQEKIAALPKRNFLYAPDNAEIVGPMTLQIAA